MWTRKVGVSAAMPAIGEEPHLSVIAKHLEEAKTRTPTIQIIAAYKWPLP